MYTYTCNIPAHICYKVVEVINDTPHTYIISLWDRLLGTDIADEQIVSPGQTWNPEIDYDYNIERIGVIVRNIGSWPAKKLIVDTRSIVKVTTVLQHGTAYFA